MDGFFITPSLLVKAEYVRSNYNNYPAANIRSGGLFHGIMIEAAIGF